MSVADNKARRDQSPPPTEVRLVLLVQQVHCLLKYVLTLEKDRENGLARGEEEDVHLVQHNTEVSSTSVVLLRSANQQIYH